MMRRVWSWYPSARHNLVTQGRYFCSQLQQHQTESAATDETIATWDLEVKQQFRILYERAQKKCNKLALRDLKHLIESCKNAEDLVYSKKAITLYHRKAQDFSLEICSIFIKKCITYGDIKIATETICKPGNRIGAWISDRSAKLLFGELASKGDFAALGEVFKAVAFRDPKKFYTFPHLEYMLQLSANEAGTEVYDFVMGKCIAHLSVAEVESLRNAHPRPAAAPEEAQQEQEQEKESQEEVPKP